MGKCEYIFAKDCSEDHAFEVLQKNEGCGSGRVSCTKSLRILFHGIEVQMERRGIVYVDGNRVTLPWTLRGTLFKCSGITKLGSSNHSLHMEAQIEQDSNETFRSDRELSVELMN